MRLPNQTTGVNRRAIRSHSIRTGAAVHASTHQWFHVELPYQAMPRRDLIATACARSTLCNVCAIQGCDCDGVKCINCVPGSLTTEVAFP